VSVQGPLLEIARAVRRFEKEEIDIAAVQSSIVSNGSAVEGASQALVDAFRNAEADLEHIQHAMRLEEQRGAALEALGPLMRELEREGAAVRRAVPSDSLTAWVSRDEESDSAYVYLCDAVPHGTVDRAVECGPVTLDFDRLGRLVGIEVQAASELLPFAFEDLS
jgi:uncharacterized protein YuzE